MFWWGFIKSLPVHACIFFPPADSVSCWYYQPLGERVHKLLSLMKWWNDLNIIVLNFAKKFGDTQKESIEKIQQATGEDATNHHKLKKVTTAFKIAKHQWRAKDIPLCYLQVKMMKLQSIDFGYGGLSCNHPRTCRWDKRIRKNLTRHAAIYTWTLWSLVISCTFYRHDT